MDVLTELNDLLETGQENKCLNPTENAINSKSVQLWPPCSRRPDGVMSILTLPYLTSAPVVRSL